MKNFLNGQRKVQELSDQFSGVPVPPGTRSEIRKAALPQSFLQKKNNPNTAQRSEGLVHQ